MSKIEKIVSGGQTGVDRAGLDVAIALQIPHGGWCPKGRKAENGTVPTVYQLNETPTADVQAAHRVEHPGFGWHADPD